MGAVLSTRVGQDLGHQTESSWAELGVSQGQLPRGVTVGVDGERFDCLPSGG